MSEPKRHIITIINKRESIALSAYRDLISFGGLLGVAYALNVLMPPSGWLNAALGISWILWLAGRGARLSCTGDADDARKFLDELDAKS